MKELVLDEFLQPISPEMLAAYRGNSEGNSKSRFPSNSEAPISRECGIYLKYDYLYDQIRELRREDDPQLTQGVWLIEPKKAAWNEVEKVCASILKNTSKDLQIAMWLMESKTVMYRLPGLTQGLQLVHGLCERFWDEIWPNIGSGGDMTARVSPFYFFAEKIADRILSIPLTAPQDGMSSALCLSDWVTARHNLRRKEPEGITVDDFQKSFGSTATDFMAATDKGVQEALEEVKNLENFLNSKCERDAPSFRNVYDNLNEIKQLNGKNFEERLKAEAEAEAKRQAQLAVEEAERKALEAAAVNSGGDIAAKDGSGSSGNNGGNGGNGRTGGTGENGGTDGSDGTHEATLDEAYKALNDIAAFLEQQQPQSPSSVLVRIASAIGKKSFKELMGIETKTGSTFMGTIADLYEIFYSGALGAISGAANSAGDSGKSAGTEATEAANADSAVTMGGTASAAMAASGDRNSSGKLRGLRK